MEGHTVRGFDGDILHLRMQVLEMGGLAIDQVGRAVAALVSADDGDARAVIERGERVAAYAAEIDDQIVGLIARRQPVASDLRLILVTGKVATDLERVGSAARKISRLSLRLNARDADARLTHFHHDVRKMARLATGMLRDALDCLDRMDVAGATAVVRRDDEIDREFQLAMRDLVTYVMEDQRLIAAAIETLFVIKSLERIGDHARNIAAAVPKLVRPDEAATAPTARRAEV